MRDSAGAPLVVQFRRADQQPLLPFARELRRLRSDHPPGSAWKASTGPPGWVPAGGVHRDLEGPAERLARLVRCHEEAFAIRRPGAVELQLLAVRLVSRQAVALRAQILFPQQVIDFSLLSNAERREIDGRLRDHLETALLSSAERR